MKSNLSISTLGSNGRFGNQLFQLLFGIGLAEYYDTKLFIPADWIGLKIFNIKNDRVHLLDSFTNTAQTPIDYVPSLDEMLVYPHIDLLGYWQFQEAIDLYSATKVREWLQFQPWVLDLFCFKNHYIVCHKRRGDYVYQLDKYCSITDNSFEQICSKLAKETDQRYVYLTEENPEIEDECELKGVGFLPDFMEMVNANIVVRSNSTFSWWPSVFGKNEVWAPVVEDKVGWQDVEFVKGNWPRMADSSHHPSSLLTDLHLKE